VKDTYNYLAIQTDVRMPRRYFRFLQDAHRHAAFERAIVAAVRRIRDLDVDCRVLDLGAGAGEHAVDRLPGRRQPRARPRCQRG
jgi:type III protein arginine methyltransferase